ncbi:ankyrin repeat domain-containing protein [Marinomonas sp.]
MKKYLFIFLFNTPLAFASSYEECIDLTAHEKFSLSDGYVEYEAVNWEKALPACEQAVTDHPEDFKVLYGLSRVYSRQLDETGDKALTEKMNYYAVKSYWAGFSHAAWVLAIEYLENKEWDQAMYWLDQNIKDGSDRAINQKALLLFDDDEEYPYKNYQEAIDLLKSASESDNKYIHFNLASLHYLDQYELLDYELALKHFTKAADLGHVSSLYRLGEIYHNGYGTETDDKKAVEYFLAAKKAGSKWSNLDQNLSQSAMNAWRQSDEGEGYEYYDLSINTLRSMALNDDQEAKTFLRQQQIAISPENTPLDLFSVKSQGEALLRRVNGYFESYIENNDDESKAKVDLAFDKYVQVMDKNGFYSEPIGYFEKLVSKGYTPFFERSQIYLAKMHIQLFLDYQHRSNAVRALSSALLSESHSVFETISSVVYTEVDEDTYDSYVASAVQIYKNYNTNFVINRFEQALKAGIPDLALIYMRDSNLNIDDQRSHDGASMLHLAIWYDYTDIAKQLIRDGADINLADNDGDKPLGYAIHMKNMELINYLNSLGAKN